MSDWKVIADNIEIFPHPNAEKMELGRVGSFQVVVAKGLYRNGDLVTFAPKRSILPPDLRGEFRNSETGKSYLKGPEEDRVGSIRLRGEESEGATIPEEYVFKKLGRKPIPGEDLSEALGITEYIPGISGVPRVRNTKSQGSVIQYVHEAVEMSRFARHDVEQFRIFQNEFVLGESVTVTEKLHGSQISIMKDKYGKIAVTSKGRAEKNFVLREYPVPSIWFGKNFWGRVKNLLRWAVGKPVGSRNEYWQVAYDSGLIDFINHERFVGQEVQIFGEVIPFQTGFSYGQTKRTVLVFRLIVDTIDCVYGEYDGKNGWGDFDAAPLDGPALKWVPAFYIGPYDPEKILPFAEGKETVSGHSLHIREGIVIRPTVLRKTSKGVTLMCKILNSKYRSSDEDPT